MIKQTIEQHKYILGRVVQSRRMYYCKLVSEQQTVRQLIEQADYGAARNFIDLATAQEFIQYALEHFGVRYIALPVYIKTQIEVQDLELVSKRKPRPRRSVKDAA